ncbi:MAG: NADH-quinone oxidoreductase subunit L, partial [Isosphaeraceae bacterium]|nr:NADH-quinone oxidoreductase subunit L [Isosphaeraceae bacterium]
AEPRRGPVAWTGSFDWVLLGAGLGPEGAETPPLVIPIGIYIDNLAVIMFVMVSLIATLIHVYSMGYMHDDPRYPLFFTYLSLFCFSMLGLVASATIFMIFVFWELVGLCSYLLIGFWFEEKKNTDAANKAFITNRIGDVGMLIGLGLLWTSLGTFNINDINKGLADERLRDELGRITRHHAGETVEVRLHASNASAGTTADSTRYVPYWVLTLAGLGIFAGCMGKSAQFPLHVWLPDAMAGPTPVSALIHAATMVAAGVYLVGRFFPLFNYEVLVVIAFIGGITLFIAASIAIVQTDYKKVLAYSTVSQLGYMMLGLGVGGWAAGLFHLLTHAFFKALLFLGAGSIYHSVHTYEMPVLGGLRPKMPITALTMLVATLAIAGVPGLSGFYSKDAILGSALYFALHHATWWAWLLFLLPSVGALMTAFYMFRLWFLIFDGEPRGYPVHAETTVDEPAHSHGHAPAASPAQAHDHDIAHHGNPAEHAHESPPIMTWPLILLAIPTVIIGWPWRLSSAVVLPIGEPLLEQMLTYGAPLRAIDIGASHWYAMVASVLIAAAGIAAAIGFYSRWKIFNAQAAAERFGPVYTFLRNKWYFDELYEITLVRPILRLARGSSQFDRLIIDGIVNSSAWVTVVLSKLEGVFDLFAIDGLVNLIARIIYVLGDWGRAIQTGRLRTYLMFLAIAVVILFLGVFFWIRPTLAG